MRIKVVLFGASDISCFILAVMAAMGDGAEGARYFSAMPSYRHDYASPCRCKCMLDGQPARCMALGTADAGRPKLGAVAAARLTACSSRPHITTAPRNGATPMSLAPIYEMSAFYLLGEMIAYQSLKSEPH